MTEHLPLHGAAVYNPHLLSPEELKKYFVVRRELLEHLLDELRREAPDRPPQHRLIVGTRGMGKTTLLRRLALAVSEDPDLGQAWLPLQFPEEQYNVARLSDLWVNCLDALGDKLEAEGQLDQAAELDTLVAGLPKGDEERRAEQGLAQLKGLAGRIDKRLILLIDNIDIVLDRLRDAHWKIREVLACDPRLLLIGASSRMLEATYEYKGAFYDFLKIHELKGLSLDETRELLCNLARIGNQPRVVDLIENEPGRLKTLHNLTGGNPRTATLLFGVLAQGPDGDVRADLERLLDQCTPLYKARFEELPAQSQQVVDGLAVSWDPITAGDLAGRLRMDVNKVSSQLSRLESQGVVEKVRIAPGTKAGFQIAERFFNIWYLMRTSRRLRKKLVWLVQFLRVFYSQDELKFHAGRFFARSARLSADMYLRHAEYGAVNLALAFQLSERVSEATELLRHLIAEHADDPVPHNGLAWLLYDRAGDLSEAERLARHAVELDPNSPHYRHTLGCILARRGNWSEAAEQARAFLRSDSKDFFEQHWPDILAFFAEAVAQNEASDSAELLTQEGLSDRWRPLYEALRAIAEGPDRLTRVAPEIRRPAGELAKELTSVAEAIGQTKIKG